MPRPPLSLRVWLRLLVLLLAGCYLGGVCELDAAEARQHYAQECHDHLLARAGVAVPAATAPQPAAALAAPGGRARWAGAAGGQPARRPWPWGPCPPPPVRRRYLRYGVLQV